MRLAFFVPIFVVRTYAMVLMTQAKFDQPCVKPPILRTTQKVVRMKQVRFVEREGVCENTFTVSGKWWHLYTSGKTNSLIFIDLEILRFAMNLLARCKLDFPDLYIVSFVIMSNHIHLVIVGDENRIALFFETFRRRLARFMRTHGYGRLSRNFSMQLKRIESLSSLRNTIVYVHRNGYVVDSSHTPFSYAWGTGPYYFTMHRVDSLISDLNDAGLRTFFHSRVPSFGPDTPLVDGYVSPAAFCSLQLGMSLFRDAHQYFSLLTKNVEAYSELACDLGDTEFLTDMELFSQVSRMIAESYSVQRVNELTRAQRYDVARKLHYEFKSSNGQIRRILNLSQSDVDQLFPLKSTHRESD